jgi:hypothetical protein
LSEKAGRLRRKNRTRVNKYLTDFFVLYVALVVKALPVQASNVSRSAE